jgi:hypothetical protein
MSETLKALQKFRDEVVSQAKAELKRQNKDTSGKLSQSIKGEVKEFPNSIGVYFDMEVYGNFQDKGVSGTHKKYNTDYSYKPGITNRPSPRHFDKWVVRKGLAPRKKGGQFASRSGIKFALAAHIQKYGIKPSLFFTKPFEKAFKKLPDVLIDKYGLDAETLLNSILNQNLKNIK